jgi:hypothetical protein
MAPRLLVVLLVGLVVAMPVAQHASPLATSHASVLKHAPRTPPGAARLGVSDRTEAAEPGPLPLAGAAPPESSVLVSDTAVDAPFVPPRS